MFAKNKTKNYCKITVLLLSLFLAGLTFSFHPSVVKADFGEDLLTTLGCDDDNKDGLNIEDCLSSGSKGTVVSFTDFKGDLRAPNPEGYAPGLTQAKDARTFILNVTNFALGFLGLIAVLVIIYGGVMSVTSAGDPEKAGKGKKAIGFAAIGLLIVMGSFAIVNTILLAPSGSETGGSGRSAINSTSIRGVAGSQRFNYLAKRIDDVLLRVYRSYQFHFTVKQQIEKAKADLLAFDEENCFVPFSSCINQLITLTNSHLNIIQNNAGNPSANAKFVTGVTPYLQGITSKLNSEASGTAAFVESEDCNSDNKMLEINPCSEDNKMAIKSTLKGNKTAIAAEFDKAEFLKQSFEEDMNFAVGATAEVFRSVSGLASQTIGADHFTKLIPGFVKSPTSTLPTTVSAESGGEYAVLNSKMKTDLTIGASLAAIDQNSIKNVLKSLVEIKSILENLKFVDTIISADVNQGNAPLIVNFSSVGSSDPSGFSITNDRIQWDLNGDGKFSGDPGNSFSGEDKAAGYMNCKEDKAATASCIFTKAGTYRVALKIKPVADQVNQATGLKYEQEIAPGVSYIDILVNPPATKINLEVSPKAGGVKKPVIIYDANTGTIKEDHDRVYFTLSEAKAGLVFDATKSTFSDGSTKLSNDPASKIRWNFGVPSTNNDTYQTPSDKTLSLEQAYPATGNYQVRLDVIDKNGVIDRKIFTVVVSNLAPRLTNSPEKGKVGEELTFDGSNSTSDGRPLIFNWKIERIPKVITTAYFKNNWLTTAAHAALPGAAALSSIPAPALKPITDLPIKVIEPSKRAEENEFYKCAMPAGKDDLLKCTFKKAGDYRVTLSLDDDGVPREESSIVTISSTPPTASFRAVKISNSAPALYKLDASSLSFDPDENDNSRLEYSWEINPGNCVLIGFADQVPEADLINASTDAYSAQTPCSQLKEFNPNISQPIVKFTQKGTYAINLAVRHYDEQNLISSPTEQNINITNVLDVAWGEMKPSALLSVANPSSSGSDQNPEVVNAGQVAPIKFIFKSSQAIGYEIDFGDGVVESGDMSKQKEITHDYTAAGKYTAKLSVFDADDVENSISRNIFIGNSDTPVSIILTKVNGSEVEPQTIEFENGHTLENVIVVSRKDNLTFDAERSINTDGSGRRLRYSWNINNNEKQSTARQVAHNFKNVSPNGVPYEVKLKVTNERDATQSGEDSVKILVVGEQPTLRSLTAVVDSDDLTTPVNIKLTAVGATDPDGQIVQYKWWYYLANNPPSPDERLGLQITTVPSATIAIGTRGVEGEKPKYKFGLEMTDNDNLTISTDHKDENFRINLLAPEIQVVNGPNKAPVARFSVDRTSVNVGEMVNFNSASFDPDAGGGIKEYKWDFGDGSRGENKASVSHAYQKANVDGYRVKLTVVDTNESEATSDIVRIFVDADAEPPVAGFTVNQTPGSKNVKFTNTSTADTAAGASLKKYSWDFDVATDSNGDGKKDNDIDSGEANPTYTYSNFGIFRAKLTVEDNQGQIRSVTNFVNVRPAEAVPATTAGQNGDGTLIASGESNPAAKSMGANLFEASNRVDLSLLLASIGAYAILFLISRPKQKTIKK